MDRRSSVSAHLFNTLRLCASAFFYDRLRLSPSALLKALSTSERFKTIYSPPSFEIKNFAPKFWTLGVNPYKK
jgi:hypothetical protein